MPSAKRHVAIIFFGVALAGCGAHRRDDAAADTGTAALGLRDAACFETPAAAGAALVGAPEGSGAGDDRIAELLARLALHAPPGLAPRLTGREVSDGGAVHFDVRYYAAGIPVCGHVIRAHLVAGRELLDNELPGALQLGGAVDPAALAWDPPEAVLALAARQLGASGMRTSLRRAERCVLLGGGVPAPGWELHADIGYLPYYVIGDARALRHLSARAHTAAGEARVYAGGPGGAAPVSVDMPDLAPGAGLASPRFTTALDDGSPAAQSASRRFDYDPGDPRFVEASLFAHAEQMAAWLGGATHRYRMTCLPVVLHAHSAFPYYGGVTVNNAMYTGPDDAPDGRAMIQVGDGDGQDLANLGVDFDVVAHELGHHVIYRRLQSRAGESGVIHEGLADYLVYARTGSACLGASICPAGSAQCVVPGSCLRTAANALKLTDPDLPAEVHQRSQFLSGMLWGLGQTPEIGQDLVATLVIKGIDYLLPESGYADLVKALMAADLELFQGAHACAVQAAAVARGLDGELAGIDCHAYVAAN